MNSFNGGDGTDVSAFPNIGTPIDGATGNYNLTMTGGITVAATGKTLTNNLPAANLLTIGSSPASTQTFKIGGTLTLAGTGNTTINEAITNNGASAGSLTLQGSGVVKLYGTNTYTGTTTVNSTGTLLVNGANNGTGAVSVNSGATLGGGGVGQVVNGPVSITADAGSGATFSPGSPDIASGIGTFTAGTTLTINNNSTLNFDLGAGGAHDQINATNTNGLTLGTSANSIAVNVANLVGNALAGGDYTLIDYNGVLNNGASSLHLVNVPTDPGYSFSLTNDPINTLIKLTVTAPAPSGDFNGDGNVNAADYVTWRKNNGTAAGYTAFRQTFQPSPVAGSGLEGGAVPEPASMLLVLLSIAGLPFMTSRRRSGR